MPRRRRRRRRPDPGELLGPPIVLALVLAYIVTRGDPDALKRLLESLAVGLAVLALVFLGLILAILAVRALLRRMFIRASTTLDSASRPRIQIWKRRI